jgi:pyridinium-3,5-biscarboxylic acid mononucleotide synthase
MTKEKLLKILEDYKNNSISGSEALSCLEKLSFEDISFAKIDHHRELRWGFPEVIFCQGKTPSQVKAIAEKIIANGSNLLATRAEPDIYDIISKEHKEAVYNEAARTITIKKHDVKKLKGGVIILTAGTSDNFVAEEACETGIMLGLDIKKICDIGVAGIHRVMHFRKDIEAASVIIVAAGMEGALASVVAGLVQSPVIAVPTSIGYGASFNGITPLLSMLNSCVPGVAVMNIDNGFGAAFLAFKFLKTAEKISKAE